MTSSTNTLAPRATGHAALPLFVFALLVLGCKCLLIAGFGSSTPLTDQWVIARDVFQPLLEGHLTAGNLLESHYQHHQLTTRLLDIVLLACNGLVWNPLLEMVLNAILHVATLALLMGMLRPLCPPPQQRAFLIFSTLLSCLPFDYANTLNGFQSQVYLVLLFSFVFLHALCHSRAFSAYWWIGVACGVLAFLSFGSGAATIAAGAVLILLRQWRRPNTGRREWLALLILFTLAVVTLALTRMPAEMVWSTDPSAGPGAPMHRIAPWASSPTEFLRSAYAILSWPTTLLGLFFYAPLLRFMWQQLRQRPAADAPSWQLFALGLWMLAQIVLLAYGRSKTPTLSRYTDYFVIGLLLNWLVLLRITADTRLPRWLPGVWAGILLLPLLAYTLTAFNILVHFDLPQTEASTQSIRAYLATSNPLALTPQAFPDLPPEPSPADLQALLDSATIRQILPPELVPDHAWQQAPWVSLLLQNLHSIGLLLITAGLALMLGAWLGGTRRRSTMPAPPAPGA